MTERHALSTAIFPSAGSAHIWHAKAAGRFEAQGLDVDVVEVRSSDQQMEMWDGGELAVMHTAPDHLLRQRERDPVAVRGEGIGDLSVFVRSGVAPADMRWGVDGAESAFALVLRAVVEASGYTIQPEDLRAVGGTRQRFQSMVDDEIDAAVLHAPFDSMAVAKGFERLGSHLSTLPDLVTVVAVAPRADIDSAQLRAYLSALDAARDELLAGGAPAISQVLQNQGWPVETADAAAEQMLVPGGLVKGTTSLADGLQATVRLRQRYFPQWTPQRPLDSLVEPR